MNAPVRIEIQVLGTPTEVVQALHNWYALDITQTASWGTTTDDELRRKRHSRAVEGVKTFFDRALPAQRVAPWVIEQLADLPAAVVTPADPVAFWRLLQAEATRFALAARDCCCWQLPVALPPA